MAEKEMKKGNALSRAGKRASQFFKDTKAEMKKIVWPTPQATWKSTGVVIAFIAVVGLFIFLLDTAFLSLLRLIMNVAV
jgi:preprotein translocase subunit SecE